MNNLYFILIVLLIILIGIFYIYKKNKAKKSNSLDKEKGPSDDIYPLF